MPTGCWMKRIANAYPDIAFILWMCLFCGLLSNKNQPPYLQLNLNIMPWCMPWKKHSGYDFSSLFINFLFLNLFPYSVITKTPSPSFNLKLSHHVQSILMFIIILSTTTFLMDRFLLLGSQPPKWLPISSPNLYFPHFLYNITFPSVSSPSRLPTLSHFPSCPDGGLLAVLSLSYYYQYIQSHDLLLGIYIPHSSFSFPQLSFLSSLTLRIHSVSRSDTIFPLCYWWSLLRLVRYIST